MLSLMLLELCYLNYLCKLHNKACSYTLLNFYSMVLLLQWIK